MKYLAVFLFPLFLQVYCRSLHSSKLQNSKDSSVDFDERRSARVHRVSDDGYSLISFENAEAYDLPINGLSEKVAEDEASEDSDKAKGFSVPAVRKFEKILSEFSEEEVTADEHDRREAQLLKHLTEIFKELSAGKGSKLKNFDVKVNEVADTIIPTLRNKLTSNDVDALKDQLDAPKELDVYYRGEEKEEHVKSKHENMVESPSVFHFKLIKDDDKINGENNGRYLNDVLLSVQNEMKQIRNDFEKLCRKHHILDAKRK